MGSHLDKPVTEKESDDGTLHGGLSYSGSAMQGWRVSMEDSHFGGTIQIGGDTASLAAVFDGHGGDLVAIEAAKRIKPTLEKALGALGGLGDPSAIGVKMQEAFMTLDANLRQMGQVQR